MPDFGECVEIGTHVRNSVADRCRYVSDEPLEYSGMSRTPFWRDRKGGKSSKLISRCRSCTRSSPSSRLRYARHGKMSTTGGVGESNCSVRTTWLLQRHQPGCAVPAVHSHDAHDASWIRHGIVLQWRTAVSEGFRLAYDRYSKPLTELFRLAMLISGPNACRSIDGMNRLGTERWDSGPIIPDE